MREIPTVEELREENKRYQAHLNAGGERIQIVTEMVPVGSGQEWKVHVNWPDDLESSRWTKEFTFLLALKVRAAIEPPPEPKQQPGIGGRN